MSEEKCDCWRITRELDDDEVLPDHVCFESAVESVASWADEQKYRIADLVHALIHGHPDADFPVAKFTTDELGIIEKIYDDLDGLLSSNVTHWPLPIDNLPTGIVIRQWIHEEPNTGLATMLSANSRWQELVTEYHQVFRRWKTASSHLEGDILAQWITAAGWSPTPHGMRGNYPRSEHNLAISLRVIGFPHSLRTRRYLRALAAGSEDYLPARGARITTRVNVRIDPNVGAKFRNNHDLVIDFPLATGPRSILEKVSSVIEKHLKFVGHPSRFFPFISPRMTRRYQKGSFALNSPEPRSPDDSWFDFVAEAVNSADASVLDRRAGLPAIRKHVNKAFARVRKRRADAGLDPSRPPGARDEAIEKLRQRQA